MLWVVVLHEPVATSMVSLQVWEQCILEDLDVKHGIHPSRKYANIRWVIPADSRPNVNLFLVFGAGLDRVARVLYDRNIACTIAAEELFCPTTS